MKIVMVPGSCATEYRNTGGSFCESCFARFLMSGCDPDLACISAVQDDGAEAKTLTMQVGAYAEDIALTDEARERLAYGEWQGWPAFIERVQQAAHLPA